LPTRKRSPGIPSYAAGRLIWLRAAGVGSRDGAGSLRGVRPHRPR
jgi:hypothetical protein